VVATASSGLLLSSGARHHPNGACAGAGDTQQERTADTVLRLQAQPNESTTTDVELQRRIALIER